MTQLTEHFSMAEMTHTSHIHLSNTPATEEHRLNLTYTAQQMEKVRAVLGNVPIRVNSAYRSPAVNRAVGGTATSQHASGEACDFVAPKFGTPHEICKAIMAACKWDDPTCEEDLVFDQLIYEGTWVHISFVRPPKHPRRQTLTAHFGSKTTYTQGIAT